MNVEVVTNVAQVMIDTKDPVNEKNFYRWDWTGTYEVITQPQDFVMEVRGKPVPMPKECCSQCWVSKDNNIVNLIEDRRINGSTITGHRVASIPVIPQFMATRYHLEIRQYSISEAAYDFWNVVNVQSTGNGSVQDPAPANAKSNIKNVVDNQDPVYGFFGASAMVRKQYFIERKDISVPVDNFVFPDDCRVIPGSTPTKPSFW